MGLILLVCVAGMAQAAPGDLDMSFGSGGKVTTPILITDSSGKSVALQSDGKIVVAGGYFDMLGSPHIALVRYTSTGALDSTFANGGIVTGTFGPYVIGRSVAIQSDGKIVVAGYINNRLGSYDIALVRYTSTGALDTSFGSAGQVTTSIGGDASVAIQSDGKIVVAGYANYGIALVRYTSSGDLDTSFGSAGKVTTFISPSASGKSLALQSDGKIVVAGATYDPRIYDKPIDIALVRYTSTGALDTSFGSGGMVTTPIGSSAVGYSVALQSDGKIVVTGYTSNGNNWDIALVRYTSSGDLDTSFGNEGKVTTPIGSSDDYGRSVAVQSDGKIVVTGATNNGGTTTSNKPPPFDIALVRYTSSGDLDPTFGNGGKVTTPIGSSAAGYSVTLQSDGKIVVAGYSEIHGGMDFAVVRYEVEVSQPAVTPGTATGITLHGATLSSTVNPGGADATVYFEYGTDGVNFPNAIAATPPTVNAADGVTPVSVTLSGLSALTNYYFRVKATNSVGTTVGEVKSFTTSNAAPVAPDGSANATTGDTKTITLPFSTTDADGQVVTLTNVTAGTGLTVNSFSGTTVTFTPTSDFSGTSSLSYTVGDGFGGTATGTITVTVADNDTPVFSNVPADITVNTPADAASAVVSWTEPSASDNVGVTSVTSTHNPGASFPVGTTTVTYTAKDAAGNTGRASFTVTVVDASVPVFSNVPANMTVTTPANSTTALVSWTAPSASDNVGVTSVTSTHNPGEQFPVGVTTVVYTAKDAAGNTSTASFTVTVVVDASGPVFSNIPANMTMSTPADAASAVVSWTEPSASDNVGVTSVTSTHNPGERFPVGVTTVTYTAKDAAGNTGTASFTVTVADVTKPTIAAPAGGFSPLTLKIVAGAGGIVALPDYRNQAVTYDAVGVSAVSQTPAPGTALRAGAHEVTLTVTDTSGNSDALSLTVMVATGDPALEQLFTNGAVVSGAGVPGTGIPSGAKWKSFGVPAINGTEDLAFVATLQLSPSGTLTGIFAGPADAPALLVKKGDSAPGANGAEFASFKDPLLDEAGHVAFVATISGAGVTGANNTGIWSNALGGDAPALLARKGGSVPGLSGVRWTGFTSVALASGELNVIGTIAGSRVNKTNDVVLCRYTAGSPDGELLLRKGQNLTVDGTAVKLKSFVALPVVNGSPGQRRQPVNGGLHVKVTLSDGRSCLLNNIGAAGFSNVEAMSGDALTQNGEPAGTLLSLGIAADASGSAWGSVFKATLTGTGSSGSALVGASPSGLTLLARSGEEADPNRAPGALIKAFSVDPVASEKGYAAMVSLSGQGVTKWRDTGLLWRGNGFSGLVARKGDAAPGTGGAVYGSFVSVALPDGPTGPIFVAKLLPGPGQVTARNDMGLWAADTSGAVRLLLREGDTLDGKTVARFVVLPVVLGSPAQARGYNDMGDVTVQVSFRDGTQSILCIRVP